MIDKESLEILWVWLNRGAYGVISGSQKGFGDILEPGMSRFLVIKKVTFWKEFRDMEKYYLASVGNMWTAMFIGICNHCPRLSKSRLCS